MTFGSDQLLDGIDFVIVAMGLFGVGEILYSLESLRGKSRPAPSRRLRLPLAQGHQRVQGRHHRAARWSGFILGILPGGGATMSSMVAYAVEKKAAKHPERFGKGAIQGVAGPETANNAAATSSFIPLLTLGIPANATMAVMFGALLLQGITPGPLLVQEKPDLFWGVVNSMYIGNVLLLAMSLPLIGIFVKILRIRPAILAPLTILITMIGVYTVRMNVFDMFLMVGLGIVGLPDEEGRLRTGAAGARLRARQPSGVVLPALDAPVRRAAHRLLRPADRRDAAGGDPAHHHRPTADPRPALARHLTGVRSGSALSGPRRRPARGRSGVSLPVRTRAGKT